MTCKLSWKDHITRVRQQCFGCLTKLRRYRKLCLLPHAEYWGHRACTISWGDAIIIIIIIGHSNHSREELSDLICNTLFVTTVPSSVCMAPTSPFDPYQPGWPTHTKPWGAQTCAKGCWADARICLTASERSWWMYGKVRVISFLPPAWARVLVYKLEGKPFAAMCPQSSLLQHSHHQEMIVQWPRSSESSPLPPSLPLGGGRWKKDTDQCELPSCTCMC